MKVTMIGTGYVGLVSGVCFAEIGHNVTCIDISPEIIERLNQGEIPIYEPGLSDLLERNVKSKRIDFSTDYSSIKDSKVVFLAVGTPASDSGEADLQYLYDATESVASLIEDGTIVVIKSTVPVGTSKKVRELIKGKTKKRFFLVNNPEFLKEGSAVNDFMKPDRVVIGFKEDYAAEVMDELYAPLVRQGNPIIKMSNISAEMAKYASNCMLATKISFINEIAKLCDLAGADIDEVRKGVISDKRIGPHFLYPGPGYGGSCFPKDVKALIYTSGKLGLNLEIVNAVEKVNFEQKVYMYQKIDKHFGGNLAGKSFAFWGVSFKPNTDDIREAPAISMAKKIIEAGATIKFYDPEAATNFYKLMESDSLTKGKTEVMKNKYDCLSGADALVLMTEWGEFQSPDFSMVKNRLKNPVIFDTRNIYPVKKVLSYGFEYFAIGRSIFAHRENLV